MTLIYSKHNFFSSLGFRWLIVRNIIQDVLISDSKHFFTLEPWRLTLEPWRLTLELWGLTPNPGGLEAHPGAVEAHPGAVEGTGGSLEALEDVSSSNCFLKHWNCPKCGTRIIFVENRAKNILLSEIRGSVPNFGHQGFFKKRGPRDLKTSFLTI